MCAGGWIKRGLIIFAAIGIAAWGCEKPSVPIAVDTARPFDSSDLILRQARDWTQKGKTEEAVRAYKNLIASKPKEHWAYAELGNLYRGQGKFREAAAIYAQGRAAAPDAIDLYIEDSYAHINAGEYEAAEKLLCSACPAPRGPDSLPPFGNLLLSARRSLQSGSLL